MSQPKAPYSPKNPRASKVRSVDERPIGARGGGGSSQQITIRVAASVVARADALIEFLSETTGAPTVRVDVLRAAMMHGLEYLERKAQKQ